MNKITVYARTFLTKGHERSLKAKRNILASFLIRGASLAISFVLVPLALNYVNPTKYGIWMTLSSIIAWFGFFDLGLGQGMRNKLAEALARNDKTLAKTYVSTTYAILIIIISLVFLLFIIISHFLNWAAIFNAPPEMGYELGKVVIFVFSFFCLRFILQLITTVVTADQRPALSSFYNLVWHLLSFIIIYFLTKTTSGSLLYLGIAYSGTPIIVLIFASIFLYSKSYEEFAPSFKYINFKYAKGLFSLGLFFFLNRITCLVLFSTDNIIITQILGPVKVTPYAIAHKYFYVVLMFYEILTLPFWSAFTEAYVKKEYNWIRNVVNRVLKLWKFTSIVVIVMLLLSNYVYKIWIGDKVIIPFSLSLLMAISVIIVTWLNIFSRFLNGVSKIRLATYIAIGQTILNIPLSIFLARNLNMGIQGVILATVICTLPPVFTHSIQYKKIINNKATGIWDK